MRLWDFSLYENIGQYGKEAYGRAGRKVYEELALSFASLHLHREYGATSDKIRMLRHPLIFGKTESFKSKMVRDFAEKFLPDSMTEIRIDSATAEALEGSISGETVTPSPLTVDDYCRLEWDTLVGSKDSDEIMNMSLKALEEGAISRQLLKADRADLDSDDIPDKVEISGSNITSYVDSLIIGIVHLDSDFWEMSDEAFYNRQFPVFVNHPPEYKQIARSEIQMSDEEIDEIQREFTEIFEIDLQGSFNSLPESFYGEQVDEILGIDSMRMSNMLNVTVSCKALLEQKVEDGQIQWDPEDVDWLIERMKNQYRTDIDQCYDSIVGNTENISRKASKFENQIDILKYITKNNPSSQSEIASELDIPRSTVSRYLSSEIDELVEKEGGTYRLNSG